MNGILCKQMAIDYCCTDDEVTDVGNHFTIHQKMYGRRIFEKEDCFLKIASINGKLLFSGQEEIIRWCEEEYAATGSAWFFEAKNLRKLNNKLFGNGYQIAMVHPFFIAETRSEINVKDYEIHWYAEDEIEQFRGDDRFGEAFCFWPDAPDVLGVAALRNGNILGMAGASLDSPTMWQIGINVDNGVRDSGIGKLLVTLLKNEILERGILPYYGTSISHIASQRVALGAGFVPAWAELITSKTVIEN